MTLVLLSAVSKGLGSALGGEEAAAAGGAAAANLVLASSADLLGTVPAEGPAPGAEEAFGAPATALVGAGAEVVVSFLVSKDLPASLSPQHPMMLIIIPATRTGSRCIWCLPLF